MERATAILTLTGTAQFGGCNFVTPMQPLAVQGEGLTFTDAVNQAVHKLSNLLSLAEIPSIEDNLRAAGFTIETGKPFTQSSASLEPVEEKQPKLDRKTRGQVRRVTNKLQTVERREFPSSSNPHKKYQTVIYQDGKVLCNCQGWTMKKGNKPRQCRHTEAIIDDRATRTDGEYIYLSKGTA